MWPEKSEGQIALVLILVVSFLFGMVLGAILPLAVAMPLGLVSGFAIGFFGTRAIIDAGWWYK